MANRAEIVAGKTVIIVQIQDKIDAALRGIRTKLRKFANFTNEIGLDLFGGGVIGTIPLGFLANEFRQFEDEILFLSTKVEATESRFKELVGTIRELGRTTSFTALEVAQGATRLAQAGFSADEIEKMLQATLDLGRGARIELSAAGNLLANTIRTFGRDASDAGVIASQFVAASRQGTLDVLDLKEAMKEVSGSFRNLNVPLHTSLGLITALSSRSLRGTKAGTSLNTALLNLAENAGVIKNVLGVDISDGSGGLGAAIEVLAALQERVKGLGNLERTRLIQRIFNIRGGRAIAALLPQIEHILKVTEEIKNAGDEARRAAETMDSKFGGAIRRATSALQELGLTLGQIMAGPLTDFLVTLPPLANAIQQVSAANPKLVLTILAIPPAMVLAGAALITFSFVLGKLATLITGVLSSVRLLGKGIEAGLTAQVIAARKAFSGLFKTLSPGKKNSKAIKSFFTKGIPVRAALIRGGEIGKALSKGMVQGLRGFKVPRIGNPLAGLFRRGTTLTRLNDNLSSTSSAIRSLSQRMSGLSSAIGKTDEQIAKSSNLAARYRQEALKLVAAQNKRVKIENELNQVNDQFNRISQRTATSGKARDARYLAQLGRRRKALQETLQSLPESSTERIDELLQVANRADNVTDNLKRKRGVLGKALFDAGDLKGKALQRRVTLLNRIGDVKASRLTPLKNFFGSVGNFFRKSRRFPSIGTLMARSFVGVAKGARLFVRTISKIDWVRILYRGLVTTKNLVVGFLRLANGVRRFVFSLGGITTIIELLILFGPKIEFIRRAFERLGTGIREAFGEIGKIFSLGSTSFDNIGRGISLLLAGDGNLGFEVLKSGIKTLATIIKNQLVAAWYRFVEAIAPAIDFVTKLIGSIWELIKLVGTNLKAALGSALEGFELFNTGGGERVGEGIVGKLKDFFNSINWPGVVKTIGSLVTGIGQTIISIINSAFQALASGFQTYITIYQKVFAVLDKMLTAIGTAFLSFSNSKLADLTGTSNAFRTLGEGLHKAGRGLLVARVNLNAAKAQIEDNADGIARTLAETRESLQQSFERFAAKIDALFAQDTESTAKGKKNASKFLGELIDLSSSGLNPKEIQKKIQGLVSGLPKNLPSGFWGEIFNAFSGDLLGRLGTAASDLGLNLGSIPKTIGDFIKNPPKMAPPSFQASTSPTTSIVTRGLTQDEILNLKAAISSYEFSIGQLVDSNAMNADENLKKLRAWKKESIETLKRGTVTEVIKTPGTGELSPFEKLVGGASNAVGQWLGRKTGDLINQVMGSETSLQRKELQRIGPGIAATVGSVLGTRGNLVANFKDPQEKQVDILKQVKTGIDKLNDGKQPFVFG